MKPATIAYWASLGLANLRSGPPVPAAEGRQFRHEDWITLVNRFTNQGGVDYSTFLRVRRVLESYLDRLSEARVEQLRDADEQLALYINAYNALVVYQVLLHYPVGSLRDIPTAFTRPFPVGRENLSLHQLLHARIRRFGDPRAHAAVVPGAQSAPPLRGYTGAGLQTELDEQMRSVMTDKQRGLRLDSASRTVFLSQTFRRFAGDFAAGDRMPSFSNLLAGWLRPASVLPALRPYLPDAAREMLEVPGTRLAFLPYVWSLNESYPNHK